MKRPDFDDDNKGKSKDDVRDDTQCYYHVNPS
jgi:hypothetical protein